MLRLKIGREPEWVDLAAGVRVLAAPVTSAVMMAARSDIARLEDQTDANVLVVPLTKAVARRVIVEWEGVGDEAGEALPVSPEGIDALMDLHRICEAFNARVIWPYLELQREKNASAPSPDGTSAGAEATASTVFRSARSAQGS